MEHKLKQEIENITNNLIGYSGEEMEYLFEQIIPQYQIGSRRPYGEGKWKVVNRETGEEFKEVANRNTAV